MSFSRGVKGVLFIRTQDETGSKGQITFWCPGCKMGHTIAYGGDQTWTWNGDVNRPTFTPSVLANGFPNPETPEWNAKHPRCHTFVTDGMIQYLSDCEHELAGQTVPMMPLPSRYDSF